MYTRVKAGVQRRTGTMTKYTREELRSNEEQVKLISGNHTGGKTHGLEVKLPETRQEVSVENETGNYE